MELEEEDKDELMAEMEIMALLEVVVEYKGS